MITALMLMLLPGMSLEHIILDNYTNCGIFRVISLIITTTKLTETVLTTDHVSLQLHHYNILRTLLPH